MTPYDAWARRIASGQAVTNMVNTVGGIGTEKSLTLFADWTDRIAAGELPFDKPQRPQGIERNVVLTCGTGRATRSARSRGHGSPQADG